MTTTISHIMKRGLGTTAAIGASVLLLAGCSTPTETTDLQLPAADGAAAICAELTPDSFAGADLAFRGTVTESDADQVTLTVDDTFEGETGSAVTIAAPSEGAPSEFSMGDLIVGESYLISTLEDTVLTCGQSGPASAELETLYDSVY